MVYKAYPPKPEACLNCKFWLKTGESRSDVASGECHRYPPQIIGHDNGPNSQAWPILLAGSYCGEYKEKPCEPTIDQLLDELEALEAKATPGEWRTYDSGDGDGSSPL